MKSIFNNVYNIYYVLNLHKYILNKTNTQLIFLTVQ